MWNVTQYEHFRDERSRPFGELLWRISSEPPPASIVDLGCGTGSHTLELAERWPEARVLGIDSSAEMLAAATPHPRVRFERQDLSTWRASTPVELIVSNAALHWVGDHPSLLERLVSSLSARGTLAFQVPANFEEPSHRELFALLDFTEWRARLGGVRRGAVLELEGYVQILHRLGLAVDAWETKYLHVLQGTDAVLEWMKGTTLRPVLAALEAPDQDRFLAQYAERLRASYPSTDGGTLFPFHRRFVVAVRS